MFAKLKHEQCRSSDAIHEMRRNLANLLGSVPICRPAPDSITETRRNRIRNSVAETRDFSPGLIAALWLLVGLPAFTMDAILPAQPAIGAAVGASAVGTQWIITAMLAGYALGQIPFGLAADRWGRRRMVIAGVSLALAGGLLAASAERPETLLAGRGLLGLGAAAAAIVSRAVARDISTPATLSRLMSGMIAFLTAMTLIAPLLGGALLGWLGWRAVLALTAGYTAAALLLAILFVGETLPGGRRRDSPLRQLTQSLRAMRAHRQCIIGAALVGLTHGGYFTFIGQGSSVAIEVYGFPAELYGLLFALPAGANVAMAAANRRLAARYGAPRMLAIATLILGGAGLLLLALALRESVAFSLLWGGIVLYMLGQGLLFPNASALVLIPVPQAAGFAASLLGTLQIASGALLSALAAFLYTGTHATLAAFLGAAGLLAFLLHRFGRTEFRED